MGVVLQVYDHVGINISLHAVVSIAHDLLPDLTFANLGADGSPLLCPEGVLALVWIQLDYRIEDGQV
jgi:hypothetical protein